MTSPVVESFTEYGPPREVRLGSGVASGLATTGLVDIVPTTAHGIWTVIPKGKVGVVRVGELTVSVRPKVPIQRLIFLLEYAPERPQWQLETVAVDEAADLLSAIASVFARAAESATRAGLLQGYRTVEESLPVLRGRLREADQIRLRQGSILPAEVRYDDFTVDTSENRLLRAAAERLLHLTGATLAARRTLLALRQRMAEVTPAIRGDRPPRWDPSRLNLRYQPALRLAEVILRASSFEHRGGELQVSGFVLDMPKIFEDFVTIALTHALGPLGGQVHAQYPTWLDEDNEVRIYPDIVWLNGRRPLAVVDAKYKAERYGSFPDSDLYQALAYATALGLDRAHLVYAKGNETAREYLIRNAGIQILTHALDLQLTRVALLDQVRRLASTLAASAYMGA